MPEITVSEEIYTRMIEFKRVVEAVLEKEVTPDECAGLILLRGFDSMLADLLGPQDRTTLLSSLQQLASQYPAQVYEYVAETLKRGAFAEERQRMKHKMGFLPPSNVDEEAQS